jgi:hypothetical protein
LFSTPFVFTQNETTKICEDMSGFSLSYSNSQSLYIKDGWFSETEAMWPGQKFCIEVDEVLANWKSKFQVSDDDIDDNDTVECDNDDVINIG